MKTLELVQGSDAWHAHRLAHFNASDAPVMMGVSPHKTRTALLRELAGVEPAEPHAVLQKVYEKGHEAEAAARPKVEVVIGEELYPSVGVSDEHPKLSASFDGITMDERTGYECKLWSEELAAQIAAKALHPMYVWQLEQQALVAGLERVVFAAGSPDGSKFEYLIYIPNPALSDELLAGWAQFERDLAEFKVVPAAPEAVGRAPESLPALRIEVTGMVTASNLADFKAHAIAVFRGIKTDLQTDQDFADADKTVKWCGDIEDRLKAAKDHALSQTQTIAQLFAAIDDISAEARAKRLELEKLVKARKESVRIEIVQRAREAMAQHVHGINATLIGVSVQAPVNFNADLANAIKGKKTVASVQDAADTAVARAKIETSRFADQVRVNIGILDKAEVPALFADRHTLATTKTPEDLRNLVAMRIAKHKADEAQREADMRERIRKEEADKLVAQAAPAAPAHAPAPASNTVAIGTETKTSRGGVVTTARPTGFPVRPSDDEILGVLALHYRVHESQVIEWLAHMNLTRASQRLASNL